MHVLIIIDAEGILTVGIYSTPYAARQALVDFVEDTPIRPSDRPEDWYLEPTAFDFATELLAKETDYRWQIIEVELDVDLKAVG